MFSQWSDGVTDNPRVDLNVQKDIQVEAQFVERPLLTIVYKANQGGMIVGNASQRVLQNGDGEPVIARPSQGYTFAGWDDGVTEPKRSESNVLTAQEHIAQFTPIRYTVVFDGNGATGGIMPSQPMIYDAPQPLQPLAFTNSAEGVRFMGWAFSPNGSVVYTDGQEVSNLTFEADAEVTLYAIWMRYFNFTLIALGSDRTPLANARVTIKGPMVDLKGSADEQGRFSGSVLPGYYTYAVIVNGLVTKGGSFVVKDSDVEVRVLFDSPTPVEALSLVRIHPNPAVDRLMLTNAEGIARATVCSLMGYPLLLEDGGGVAELSISVKSLPAGSYLLLLDGVDGSQTVRRFVKQ